MSSNMIGNVVVEQVGSKDVTTKFGLKPTFSFKAAGEWFKTGFKRHNLSVGDVISFSYDEGSYGKDVDPSSIKKSAAAPVGSVATVLGVAKPYVPSGGKGVFPIPPLDGQRSIVRQNSLTNARELVVSFACEWLPPKVGGSQEDHVVDTIIRIARKFEAYSSGDIDAAELEAELAAEKKAA